MSTASYVAALHASRVRASVVLSGGGGSLASSLLSVPGCSATLLDLYVPYATRATDGMLGFAPEKYVSKTAAVDLAHAALGMAKRCLSEGEGDDGVEKLTAGVGLTAALVSTTPRRGLHHAHAAVWTDCGPGCTCDGGRGSCGVTVRSLVLSKELGRSREAEDKIAGLLALEALGDLAGVGEAGALEELRSLLREDLGERVQVEHLGPGWPALLRDPSVSTVTLHPDGTWSPGFPTGEPLVVMSGSLNPIHDGHVELLTRSVSQCVRDGLGGATGAFELSVVNADKGSIDTDDIRRRAGLVRKTGFPLVLTLAPLFMDKARKFPRGTRFAVGYDTAERLVQERYYPSREGEPSDAGLSRAMSVLLDGGHVIYVAPRAPLGEDKVPLAGAELLTLRDIALPKGFETLFVPLEGFRNDSSSSAIRLGKQK